MRFFSRGLVLCGVFVVPACNVVVLADDTEASEGASSGGVEPTSGEDVPTGGTGEEGGVGEETGAPPMDGVCDFPGTVQPIFTASCGCHGGGQPASGLALNDGAAYAALVGVDSAQQAGVKRVQAGAPEASYLIDKLEVDPPVGERMPVGGALSDAQISVITAWIAAGAPAVDAFACAGGGEDVDEVVVDVAGKIEVQVGEIVEVDASVFGAGGELANATVTWSSSAERALYVDGTGALLGISVGTAELRAHSGGVDSAPVIVEVVAHQPAPATFTQVRAVTDARCAVDGCHVDGVEPGDLRFDRDVDKLWEELLEDEAEQVDGLARIDPGAPEDSYVVQKLVMRAPAVGAQMPIGLAPMPAEEVRTIVRWVLAGAPNN